MKLKECTVLVVDDDEAVLIAVQMLLKSRVKKLVTEKNPENLLALLSMNRFDTVILDMNYKSALNTGNEGFFWLKKIRERDPQQIVIMITAYGDIDVAIRSLKKGASDFLIKPWRNEKLIETLEEVLEKKSTFIVGKLSDTFSISNADSDNQISKPSQGFSEIIGESDQMQEVLYKINKIAPTEASVLILGENGTGKDLVAKLLHEKSGRAAKPLISVDLGSLTETLFESELFGHKKGAFTDAREDRMGRMEAASGGTLFLDEIGNISMYQQAKLLSVLQNKQVIRLGSNQVIPIDFRLISATNMPIYEMADESRFRKDLIYRINTIEVKLPPLRNRGEDIVLLAEYYLQKTAKIHQRPTPYFESDAIKKLKKYNWPGNRRELQHAIERALILSEGDALRASDFDFNASNSINTSTLNNDSMALKDIEKDVIMRVIEKHNGNISKAAKELELTRTALYRRLNKYDL